MPPLRPYLPTLLAAATLCPSLMARAQPQVQAQPQKSSDEQIVVTAQRRNRMEVTQGGQLGALGTKRGLDVPFNIRSYNASLILNQQSQTLGEVLENDPSVRTTYGYGNFSELFVIRGFPVYGDDVSIDGLYGITPRQLVSPQLYESVQVLNGASAFLNGAAPGGTAIGGNINLIFKKATDAPISRLTGDYTSRGQGGGSIDFSRRFGPDNQFGARINVAGLSGQTPVDHETHHSVAVGGAFDWRSRDRRTRVTLDIAYQNQGVDWGRPAIFLATGLKSVPRPPSPSTNFGQPWTFTELNYIFGKLGIEHDFSDNVMGYLDFGGLGANERGNYSTLTVTNPATGAATNGNLYVPFVQTNESTRGGLRIHARTGPVKHEVNLGGSSIWSETDTAYALSLKGPIASNLYTPIYAPKPTQSFIGGDIVDPRKNRDLLYYSLFFSDTASFFGDRVGLTGGFRYQNILNNSFGYALAGPKTTYNRDAITPVVGVVVHVTRHASVYFNRIEGLSPGPNATGAVVNAGQIFPPYKTTQYEAGAKYDIGTFGASLAFYTLSQPNALTQPLGTTGQSIFTVDGRQRNQGIELNINGQILRGLRFNGGATVIDADLKRTAGGLYDGNRAVGVPGYTINGNLEYDVPFIEGATLVGRVVQTGHQWANQANTQRLPAWTRFDLGTRYTFLAAHHPLTVRFGVDNIANRRYWASSFGGYLLEGAPRTYKLSLTADF